MVNGLPPMPPRIRSAMLAVPRHRFVPPELRAVAYADVPLPLAVADATISAPHMVALQLEALDVRPGDRVLEIGAGSGYLAALLAVLAGPTGRVVAIDLEPALAATARRQLDATEWGARVAVHAADGRRGWPADAPYDRIVVSCATAEVLPAWIVQLAPLGRLVAPVGSATEQRLTIATRTADGVRLTVGTPCRFVALRSASHPIYRP